MGIDVVTLALAKGYTDGKIRDAAFGDVLLDTSLTKKGQAADAKAVGDAITTKIDRSEIEEIDAIEIAADMGLVSPVVSVDGSIYTNENGAMYSL